MLRHNLIGLLNCGRIDTEFACNLYSTDILPQCARYGLINVISQIGFFIRGYNRNKLCAEAIKAHQESVLDYLLPHCQLSKKDIIRKSIKYDFIHIFEKFNVNPNKYVGDIIRYDAINMISMCKYDINKLKSRSIKYYAYKLLIYSLANGAVVVARDLITAASRYDATSVKILYEAAPHLMTLQYMSQDVLTECRRLLIM
jgi:hypothetical protein